MKFKLRTTANENESIAASPIIDMRLSVTCLFYGWIPSYNIHVSYLESPRNSRQVFFSAGSPDHLDVVFLLEELKE